MAFLRFLPFFGFFLARGATTTAPGMARFWGAGISPDQKDLSVCAAFAQSDTDSIRLRVAAGLPLGEGRGIKINSRSTDASIYEGKV
jgi:hypothetical protein